MGYRLSGDLLGNFKEARHGELLGVDFLSRKKVLTRLWGPVPETQKGWKKGHFYMLAYNLCRQQYFKSHLILHLNFQCSH